MIYRGPGFLTVACLAHRPPSPVSEFDWRYTGDWESETTCRREWGGVGWRGAESYDCQKLGPQQIIQSSLGRPFNLLPLRTPPPPYLLSHFSSAYHDTDGSVLVAGEKYFSIIGHHLSHTSFTAVYIMPGFHKWTYFKFGLILYITFFTFIFWAN